MNRAVVFAGLLGWLLWPIVSCPTAAAMGEPASELDQTTTRGGAPDDTSAPDEDHSPSSHSDDDGDDGAPDDDASNADPDNPNLSDNPARTALPELMLPEPPKWQRRIELGGDFAYVSRPFNRALSDSPARFEPAIAWGLHLHWDIFPFLRFHPYFIDAHHTIALPQGALVSGTPKSISAQATVTTDPVRTFVFGAKLAPTWRFTERARGWVSVGVGWGRFEFPLMTVTETNGTSYEIRERNGVFVEIPVGIGLSFDIIPRWLAIEYEATAAPVLGQSGTGHEIFQAVDADGNIRDVAGFGAIEASFVQTLGLSLIL